ncbi:hypothetical protein LTS18_001289 [Coniosporium uncinatum]|uniref:Uncharacterized protein n=1 Tax=Coniosporium uncinatum TaxID=93489 RepID=A0ACC3D848_9PEZI|nr:hypothetical protein LTS18_001289 [Coniosporium uncinatum]
MHPVYLVLDTCRERKHKDDTVQYSFSGSLPFPADPESDHKKYPDGSREQEHVFEKGSPHDQPSKKFPVEFVVSADNHTLRSWERYMRLHARHDGDHVYSSPHASADSQSNVLEQRARIPASPSLERIVYTVDLPPVPEHPEQRAIQVSHTQARPTDTIFSGRSRPADRGRVDTEFHLAEALPTTPRGPATASYAITALPAMASAAPDPTQQADRRGSTGSTSIRSIHSNHAQPPPPKLKRHNTVVSVRKLSTAGKDEHISWTPPSRPLSTASFSRPRHSTTTSVSTMTSNASTSILSPVPASQDAPEVPQLPILRFSTPNSIASVTQPISRPPSLPAPPPKDPAYVALASPSQNLRHVPSWPKTAAAATTTAPPSLAPLPPMPSSAASRSIPPSPTQGAFSSTAQIMHYYEEPPSSSSLGAAGMRAIAETQPFVMQAPPASKKKALREKGVTAAAAAGTAATPTSASTSASTLVSTPQKPMHYLSKRNASPEDEPLLPDWGAAEMPRSPVSPTTMTRERERQSKRTTVDDIEASVGEAVYPPRKSSVYQFQHQQHHNRQQPLEREEGGVGVTQTAETPPPQNPKSHLEPSHPSTSPGDNPSSAPTTPQTPSFPDILRNLGGLTRSNTQGTTKTYASSFIDSLPPIETMPAVTQTVTLGQARFIDPSSSSTASSSGGGKGVRRKAVGGEDAVKSWQQQQHQQDGRGTTDDAAGKTDGFDSVRSDGGAGGERRRQELARVRSSTALPDFASASFPIASPPTASPFQPSANIADEGRRTPDPPSPKLEDFPQTPNNVGRRASVRFRPTIGVSLKTSFRIKFIIRVCVGARISITIKFTTGHGISGEDADPEPNIDIDIDIGIDIDINTNTTNVGDNIDDDTNDDDDDDDRTKSPHARQTQSQPNPPRRGKSAPGYPAWEGRGSLR